MSFENFEKVPIMRYPDKGSGRQIKKFQALIGKKYQKKFLDYWDIHKWTVDHVAEFWEEMWDYTGVIASKKYDKVIDLSIPMNESPEWFPGAKLNIAENLLKFRDDHKALICTGENRKPEYVTYKQMYEEASLYASAFRKFGLKKGDRVVCYMSHRKEAIIAMQAVTSIAAVWSAAIPLLGPQAVLKRFSQIKPKIFITIDRIPYNGEEINLLPRVQEIVEGLPSLERVIIVASNETSKLKNISGIKNSCFLDEFLETGYTDGIIPEMKFEQVSFSQPAFISFTSGTMGNPKAMTHGFGFILANSRDFWLHADASRESVWFSKSQAGWVSWNMMSSLTFTGLTILLYEGVPYFKSPTYVWDMVDKFRVSHLFLAASTLDDLDKKGFAPGPKNRLSTLKCIFSSGSIVKSSSYNFIYKKVKKEVVFASIYGSTEMIGMCIVPESTLPIYRGEINSPSLGINIECVDETGQSVQGKVGELLVTTPSPGMLLGLWEDKNDTVFKKTYFSKYPGKFAIGDHGVINPISKGILICGRSDDTLKQRGTRFGSIEIYNAVDTLSEIRDSLCVAQFNKDRDERAVLFLKLKSGEHFNEQLVQKVKEAITRELTADHIPEVILEIQDIPYSVNGKKMEIIVKNIINNMPYKTETLVNPECLKNFMNIPQLQGF